MKRPFPLPPMPILIYLGVLSAAFAGLQLLLVVGTETARHTWWDIAFWAVLVVIAVRAQVKLPVSASISHLFVVSLALAVYFSNWIAPALVFLFYLNRDLGKPHYAWFKDLFNRLQHATATAIAVVVWNLINQFLPAGAGGLNPADAVAIALSALVYFLVNVSLFVYVVHLATGASLKKIWYENVSWSWVSYLVLSPIGLLLARAYENPLIGGWGGFTVLFMMLLLYFSRFYWDEKVKLEQAFDSTVETLVSTLDAKDAFTRLHSERVAAISGDIAKAMGFDEPDVKRITYAARIHDIGKIAIPDSVLLKPSKLAPEEFALIKSHSERGLEVLKPMRPFLAKGVQEVILHHHERWDGTGYPAGKKGEEIPRWARVVALADAYEAMTAGRVYTRAKSPEEALNEIIMFSGRQFDPEVVRVFEQLWLEDRTWKDREVFLRLSTSPVPFLDLPLPSASGSAQATTPSSS